MLFFPTPLKVETSESNWAVWTDPFHSLQNLTTFKTVCFVNPSKTLLYYLVSYNIISYYVAKFSGSHCIPLNAFAVYLKLQFCRRRHTETWTAPRVPRQRLLQHRCLGISFGTRQPTFLTETKFKGLWT